MSHIQNELRQTLLGLFSLAAVSFGGPSLAAQASKPQPAATPPLTQAQQTALANLKAELSVPGMRRLFDACVSASAVEVRFKGKTDKDRMTALAAGAGKCFGETIDPQVLQNVVPQGQMPDTAPAVVESFSEVFTGSGVASAEVDSAIATAASNLGLDYIHLHKLMMSESSGDPTIPGRDKATGKIVAIGLMQVKPSTMIHPVLASYGARLVRWLEGDRYQPLRNWVDGKRDAATRAQLVALLEKDMLFAAHVGGAYYDYLGGRTNPAKAAASYVHPIAAAAIFAAAGRGDTDKPVVQVARAAGTDEASIRNNPLFFAETNVGAWVAHYKAMYPTRTVSAKPVCGKGGKVPCKPTKPGRRSHASLAPVGPAQWGAVDVKFNFG